MNKLKVFNENFEVGGLKIPADFNYITSDFIKEFEALSYIERVDFVCSFFTKNTLDVSKFLGLNDVEFPASIMALDDNLAVVELFDGAQANYTDYILKTDDTLTKIASIIALILSVYVDLVESNLIIYNQKINISLPENDGLFAISTYIAMKIGVPINAVIVGGKNLVDASTNGLYTYNLDDADVLDCLYNFFYDYDYLVDSYSAKSLLANEFYLEENNKLFTVIFAFMSPYYDAMCLAEVLTGKKCNSEVRANTILLEETAIEKPAIDTSNNFVENFANNVTFNLEKLLKFM